MNVAITGASGLIGAALISKLKKSDHTVQRFVRANPGEGDVLWDPSTATIDSVALGKADAVVHLAGESIAEGRWNAAKKARIRESRVAGTALLCETLAKLERKPKVLVAASAIGFYGDQADRLLAEADEPGEGFLPDVCVEWEASTRAASDAGIRVVNLRIGVVLSPEGGALSKMLLPFRLGGGGRVGSGKQWWSWISIDDVVGAIEHSLATESIAGPVNAVSPNPTTNAEFTKILGRVLRRPTILPMPAFAARLVLGEMANGLLLASTRVEPKQLVNSGYEFLQPTLEESLRHLLAK